MLTSHPSGLPAFQDHLGEKRVLACLTPAPEHKLRLPRFNAPVPRSAWTPINRRVVMPWIMDQNGHGSCVGNGSVGALRRARLLSGQKDVPLSPAALYAQINGGQDQGAIISDALMAMTTVGTCSFELVGQDPIYLAQLPAAWKEEAAHYRILMAYHANTFDELCSGIMLGCIAVFGLMVGDNFEDFDRYGVAGHSPGPGNHCLMADGIVLLPDGRPTMDTVNSWRFDWGPFRNGRLLVDQEHIDGGGDMPDAFLIQAPWNNQVDEPLPAAA